MGVVRMPESVMPLCAITTRYDDALDWSVETFAAAGFQVRRKSELFAFDMTNYYQAEMGNDLKKQIFAFEPLRDPQQLADWKLLTNQWELDFKAQNSYPEDRPLNLDSGYLTLAKFVLATTKDRDHRLYLRDGIFAEVTMSFTGGSWKMHPWTYPDYQTEPAMNFLNAAREELKALFKEARRAESEKR
ncbi:DUF4416 family protein [Rosistilla oblonga]|uniref:DUF4416 family protein n=1 Tax=Rosistilla oblonga TaxID=2527990 RepID=UPI003A974B1F